MTDIIYLRKIAEIMARDGPAYLRPIAQQGLTMRNIPKSTRRKLKSWAYTWIDNTQQAHHSHINAWWREKHK